MLLYAQVVAPYVTEPYSASSDPPDQAVPVCTIKTFPYHVSYYLSQITAISNSHGYGDRSVGHALCGVGTGSVPRAFL